MNDTNNILKAKSLFFKQNNSTVSLSTYAFVTGSMILKYNESVSFSCTSHRTEEKIYLYL